MNALTRILMNVVRAYNAEQLLKLLKIAQVGSEALGAGVYFDKESKDYVVFFVRDGEPIKGHLLTKDEDEAVGKAENFAAERCEGNTCVAAGLGTCDDLKCDASDAGQLQGIDRHDDPFYDTSDADDVREHSQEVDVGAPDTEVRACTNEECDWQGTTERMVGSVGPLCEECGDTTEVVTVAHDTEVDVTTKDFQAAYCGVTDGPATKVKIKKGRAAQRRANKRKGNKAPRGYNAQPSALLGKMFDRSPETLAD